MIRYLIALIAFFLLSPISFGQTIQTQPIVQSQTTFFGEEHVLLIRLIDYSGNPITDADVRAFSDFFDITLFDDGQHKDQKPNDGIYGTPIIANASAGTHVITVVYTKGNVTNRLDYSLQIIEKTNYVLIAIAVVIAGVSVVAILFVRKLLGRKKDMAENIKKLEDRKLEIEESKKRLTKEFYMRKIEEKALSDAVGKYKEETMHIDMELEKLRELMKRKEKAKPNAAEKPVEESPHNQPEEKT